jgi:hypothetical protein
VDELLEDAGAAATELGRVAREQPAVVELQPLPPARPLRHMRCGARTLGGRLGRTGQMLVEEGDEFRAERLHLGVERQLHHRNISST